MEALKMKIRYALIFIMAGIGINVQFKTVEDSLDYVQHYKKILRL